MSDEVSRVSAPVQSGLTQKQDRFAHLVAEGRNFSAAYRAAYAADGMAQTSIWAEAHRLSRHPRVRMKIAELVAARAEEEQVQARVRAFRVTAHLEEMMNSASSESVRLRAAELLGKTVGLFAEKVPAETDDRSLAELEEDLLQRLRRLRPINP